VIRGDRPWENDYAVLHGTVLWDPAEELFKAWYHCDGCCYAVSRDGLNWEKPEYDLFPWQGRATNIVYRGFDPKRLEEKQFNLDNVSVMIRPDETDPGRRYRLFTFQAPTSASAKERYGAACYGYYTACSADGVHWHSGAKPVLSRLDDPDMSDCHTCMYDPLKRRFIAFTKRHLYRPDGVGDQGPIQRVRGISFSSDFEHWTTPRTCLVPDDHDDRDVNLYNMSGFVYEGMYLGLIEVYHSSDDHRTMARMRDVQLVSSRDGEHWWRAGGRRAFLSPSGQAGRWDAYMLDIHSGGPILRGERLWFYYGGRARHHVPGDTLFPRDRKLAAIGLATLRRDGFVSYDADAEGGTLTTKPLMIGSGGELRINASVRGDLRAEVLEVAEVDAPSMEPSWRFRMGGALEGFGTQDCRGLTGDCMNEPLTWRGGGLGRWRERPVILRFHLTDGEFYSFWMA